MGLELTFLILPWRVSPASQPAAFCLMGYFSSLRTQYFSKCGPRIPGQVPKTLSGGFTRLLAFFTLILHECKEFEKFIDRYLDSALQLKFKKLPWASLGVTLKNNHNTTIFPPFQLCAFVKLSFLQILQPKQNITRDRMQKQPGGSMSSVRLATERLA